MSYLGYLRLQKRRGLSKRSANTASFIFTWRKQCKKRVFKTVSFTFTFSRISTHYKFTFIFVKVHWTSEQFNEGNSQYLIPGLFPNVLFLPAHEKINFVNEPTSAKCTTIAATTAAVPKRHRCFTNSLSLFCRLIIILSYTC